MPRRIAFSAVTIAALMSAACRGGKATSVIMAPGVADSADQVLAGVRSLLTTRGVVRGELIADTAYVLDDQNRYDLHHAHVNFKTETGAAQGTMDADHAIYNLRSQQLDGRGHVIVRLVDGRTLQSPHVIYNQATHTISSDTTYELAKGPDVQRGKGFTSNESFTAFKCLANCGGSMNVLLPK